MFPVSQHITTLFVLLALTGVSACESDDSHLAPSAGSESLLSVGAVNSKRMSPEVRSTVSLRIFADANQEPSLNTSNFSTCTGTYIAPQVVLTAAHCVEKFLSDRALIAKAITEPDGLCGRTQVRWGEQRSKWDFGGGPLKGGSTVTKVLMHSQYRELTLKERVLPSEEELAMLSDDEKLKLRTEDLLSGSAGVNDLALIFFSGEPPKRPFASDDQQFTIARLVAKTSRPPLPNQDVFRMAGFGAMSFSTGPSIQMRHHDFSLFHPNPVRSTWTLLDPEIHTTKGDSGGPLYLIRGAKKNPQHSDLELIGILNRGLDNIMTVIRLRHSRVLEKVQTPFDFPYNAELPSIGTDLRSYREWIETNSGFDLDTMNAHSRTESEVVRICGN